MKKLLLLIACLMVTGALAAGLPQAKPEQKPDPKATPNIAGKWLMTLELSMGTGTPTLELKQDADKITGTYTGRYGTFPLEGHLKGRALDFAVQMSAEGQSFTMNFAGEVAADGQTMKGTAAMGEIGDATWTAKKEKTAS
jgi:hypothetical protein